MANNEEATQSQVSKIDRHKFYFETPLYEFVKNENLSHVLHSGEIDAYSAAYQTPTTYAVSWADVAGDYYTDFRGYKRVSLKNKRKSDDVLVFFVIQFEEGYMKVGQLPSLADLQYSELTEKYSKQLGNEQLILFKKAIGLAAHGIGAGSFVYLRKIFEALIREAYQQHKNNIDVPEEDFIKLRMTEKVDKLNNYLPSQLVAMKSVYGILSSGVHELTEEECLLYFQPIKLSIELILDQKIDEDKKRERDKKVKAEIAAIEAQLKIRADESPGDAVDREAPFHANYFFSCVDIFCLIYSRF